MFSRYMEFTERIDLNASNWLLSQLSDDFLKQNFLEGETDERFLFTCVKRDCKIIKRTKELKK